MKQVIGIVSHDAGGAEILSRLIRNIDAQFLFAIKGPAVEIFQQNIGEFENFSIENLIEEVDYFICGTSWQSTHENYAQKLAQEHDKHVISVLDHYSSYLERYVKDGFDIIPSEFWVTDVRSRELAQALNPSARITVTGNPYLEDLRKKFDQIEHPARSSTYTDILYLTEPTSIQALVQFGDENALGYTEFEALEFFLNNISYLGGGRVVRVHIRPHPSEPRKKYEGFVGDYDQFQVYMCDERDLLLSMAKAHAIVGCDTMAMLLGVEVGMKVFSSLPPNDVEPTIPTNGINYLREIVTNGK